MRKTLLVLAALLLAGVAQAQPPSFTEAYQVRAALGDIPTTTDVAETAGAWNIEQRLTVQFDNTSSEAMRTVHFGLAPGAALRNVTCDCPAFRHVDSAGAVAITIDAGSPSGLRTLRVTTSQTVDSAFGFNVRLPPEASTTSAVVIVYVPAGSGIDSNAELTSPGGSTSGAATIWYAQFGAEAPMPFDLWFAVHPDDATVTAVDQAGWADNTWLFLALGVLVGAVAWAFLVSRGVVQTKGRKQVAGTAAHVEAASNDPPAVLEGKKRALMAALKEVELAKQSNQMPIEVYDAVKADLKKQTVTVMRALESAPPADKPT